jgi:hypothetical protein
VRVREFRTPPDESAPFTLYKEILVDVPPIMAGQAVVIVLKIGAHKPTFNANGKPSMVIKRRFNIHVDPMNVVPELNRSNNSFVYFM